MDAKAFVEASEFQAQFSEIKRIFSDETDEDRLLLYLAKKYYTDNIVKVKKIVRNLREVDASAPLEKVDLVTASLKYRDELSEKEKSTKKDTESKDAEYGKVNTEYNQLYNKICSLNYDVQSAKNRKTMIKVGLVAVGVFGFFGMGGFVGIASFLSLLTFPMMLGIIAAFLVGSAAKRWYDNNIKKKKAAQLVEKEQELKKLKDDEPEKAKERKSAKTSLVKAKKDYADAVAKKTSENTELDRMKVGSILQFQADQTIKEMNEYATGLLSGLSSTDTAYRSILSWKKYYTTAVGFWLSKNKLKSREDLDMMFESFQKDVDQVAADSAYSANVVGSVSRGAVSVPSGSTMSEVSTAKMEEAFF